MMVPEMDGSLDFAVELRIGGQAVTCVSVEVPTACPRRESVEVYFTEGVVESRVPECFTGPTGPVLIRAYGILASEFPAVAAEHEAWADQLASHPEVSIPW